MQGWDVFIYINKLLLELLEHGKRLKVIAYTDMQSLYKNVHIMKNTLEIDLYYHSSRNCWKKWNKHNMEWKRKTTRWYSHCQDFELNSLKMIEL